MPRDREYLLDILEAARLALRYVSGKRLEEFLADSECQDAVIRRLEIIGEASRRLSEETRAALPGLPWHDMLGMRNILIHEYDNVDLVMVWHTIHTDLPILVSAIQEGVEGCDS